MLWLLLLALGCLAIAAALAAVDTALMTVSHSAIDDAAEDGDASAVRVRAILDSLPANINVIVFVRIVLEALSTIFIVLAFGSILGAGFDTVAVSVAIASVSVFIIAGISPRTIGRRRAFAVSTRLSRFISILLAVLRPVTTVLVWLGNLLTPDRVYKDGPFVDSGQLRDLVERASESDIIEDGEREMIQSVFDLSDTSAKQVMVPRPDLVTVVEGTPLHKVMNLFLRSGFSRIPVSGDDLDDIEGVAYLKDVARRLHLHPEDRDRPVEILARQVLFVPETKPADELLTQMQLDSTHLAILVDEYGGTSGLVTIEDIVEEIVGEIEDEYDSSDDDLVEAADGTSIVSSRMSITDLAEHFDVRIDEDDVTSVGGLLTKLVGRVPIAGSTATVSGLRITALPGQGRRHRITHVRVEQEED